MQKKERSKPELLAPAGSLDKLKTAIHYGADAVYMAGQQYSLRAHATFSDDEITQAISHAHSHGVRVYITVNIFAHNRDFDRLGEYLAFLGQAGADGLIISDPGILAVAKKTVPTLPIHLSTQANVTNTESALFWQNQGVSRLNLARELGLAEIATIKNQLTAEIEIFVHGALCISYSGRCNLSLYLTGRDANRGDCAHPCRYSYKLLEEKRPDKFFPVEEDSRGTYIFNSKDLCLINRLPALVAAGVDAIKIEGRMKSLYYVAAVTRTYRAALDYISETSEINPDEAKNLPKEFMEELYKVGSRGYTDNFYEGPPQTDDMLYDGPKIQQAHAPLGVVRKAGSDPVIEARNPIRPGDIIEYLGSGLSSTQHRILTLRDLEGNILEQANPGNRITMEIDPPGPGWEEHSLLRKGA